MKIVRRARLRAVLTILLLTGLFTSLFIGGAVVLYAKNGIDASLDLDDLVAEQGRTTKLYYTDADGSLAELAEERLHGTENRIWIPLSDVPTHVQNAFIAIEDHRFYDHGGVDVKRTAGAVLSFLLPGRDYGGSTITQQLIKNLTGDSAVAVKRKLTEIMRSLELEKHVSKEKILEAYLNTVYLSHGCYGLETASEYYFGKKASELTLDEGATLAAIIQYPTRYDPVTNSDHSRERRNVILYRMLELDMISVEEYDAASGTETALHLTQKSETGSRHSWFTEIVIEDVICDLMEARGLSRTAASRLLYSGGLTIVTTMDKSMQDYVSAFYADASNFPKNQAGERADSATVLIDPKTGYLLAAAGGVGEKTRDRGFHLATQMLRSPGSVIKPITVFAPALDAGLITWATVYDDVPITFTQEKDTWTPWPKNNPRVYAGLTTVATALEKSTNTVAVRILQALGVRKSFDTATTLGITTLVESQTAENGKTFSDLALAPLALGAVTRGVSVREITGAYTALANGGVYRAPISYTAVYDKNGELLLSHEDAPHRVFSEETADLMTRMLSGVVSRGTASAMALKKTVKVAGKTGTSNADTDRWFIGYTPELLCGVWSGYKDARDMGKYTGNPAVTVFDALVGGIYGARASDRLALDKTASFLQSENVVSCLYCQDSGKLLCSVCSQDLRGGRIAVGYFKKGTEPTEHCQTHILVDYDHEHHAVACEKCPEESCGTAALLRVGDPAFPYRVTVTDAQYVYRYLPFGIEPTMEENRAFFEEYYEQDGTFVGTSGVSRAANRYCAEHALPPEPEETTAPEETIESAQTEETKAISPPEVEPTSPPKQEETTSFWRHIFG